MGRLIKQGVNGADLRAVQDVLNFHSRRLAPLKVDGIFGPATHADANQGDPAAANRVQGDFITTIDWTCTSAQSKPQIDLKGVGTIGVQGV